MKTHVRIKIVAIPLLAAAVAVPYAAASRNDRAETLRQAADKQSSGYTVPEIDGNGADNSKPKPMQPPTSDNAGQSGNNSSENSVTINGQTVPLPENGRYQKTIDDGNSHTDISVDSKHSSTTSGGNASNSSSVKLDIHSESHSSSSD